MIQHIYAFMRIFILRLNTKIQFVVLVSNNNQTLKKWKSDWCKKWKSDWCSATSGLLEEEGYVFLLVFVVNVVICDLWNGQGLVSSRAEGAIITRSKLPFVAFTLGIGETERTRKRGRERENHQKCCLLKSHKGLLNTPPHTCLMVSY